MPLPLVATTDKAVAGVPSQTSSPLAEGWVIMSHKSKLTGFVTIYKPVPKLNPSKADCLSLATYTLNCLVEGVYDVNEVLFVGLFTPENAVTSTHN